MGEDENIKAEEIVEDDGRKIKRRKRGECCGAELDHAVGRARGGGEELSQ